MLVDQVVQLDEVELLDAQPLERAVQAVARPGVGAVAGLRRQEEAVAVARHPRADAQLGVAVRRRRVDVVDAVLEQHLEDLVGLLLPHGAERRGAEDHAGAAVAGAPERSVAILAVALRDRAAAYVIRAPEERYGPGGPSANW